jgi:hypothetical protein
LPYPTACKHDSINLLLEHGTLPEPDAFPQQSHLLNVLRLASFQSVFIWLVLLPQSREA